MWLAGVPIKVSPGQWLVQSIERKHTVPPKLKRVLAEFAIGTHGVRPGGGRAWRRCWPGRDGVRQPTLCDRSGGQRVDEREDVRRG